LLVLTANRAGSTDIDATISRDGRFIYTLDTASGTSGVFPVAADSKLSFLRTVGALPTAGAVNEVEAY